MSSPRRSIQTLTGRAQLQSKINSHLDCIAAECELPRTRTFVHATIIPLLKSKNAGAVLASFKMTLDCCTPASRDGSFASSIGIETKNSCGESLPSRPSQSNWYSNVRSPSLYPSSVNRACTFRLESRLLGIRTTSKTATTF